jgi:hypothetical protein
MSVIFTPMFEEIAKYVIENHEGIKNSTEDELVHEFYKLLDLPVKKSSIGMGPSIGPVIGNISSGLGTSRQSKVVKKDAPDFIWMSFEKYIEEKEKGMKICSHTASRSINKDKVCGARVDNPTSEDFKSWRCQKHAKGGPESGSISRLMKTPVNGIDPKIAVRGTNIPSPTTGISGLPPPPFTKPAMPSVLGGLSGLPPPILKTPSPASISTPPLPPVMQKMPPPPPVPSPVPVKPVEPEPVAETNSLVKVEGLKDNHYLATHSSLNSILFKYDGSGISAIGKLYNYNGKSVSADYMESLSELSLLEKQNLERMNIKYEFEKVVTGFKLPTF